MRAQRFYFDPTGLIRPRKLNDTEITLAAQETLARREAIEASLPSGLKTAGAALLDQLAEAVTTYEALLDAGDDPVVATVEPSARVAALLPASAVGRVGEVNHFEDNLVGIVRDATSSGLRRREGDPKRAAAEALNAVWFADGATFLSLDSRAQWLEVALRLRRTGDDERAAAVTLGVDDVLGDLTDVNDYFGKLQGLTGPLDELPPLTSSTDRAAAVLEDIAAILSRALCFGAFTFPDDSEVGAANRLRLSGPLLSALNERSEAMARVGRGDARDDDTTDDGATTDDDVA